LMISWGLDGGSVGAAGGGGATGAGVGDAVAGRGATRDDRTSLTVTAPYCDSEVLARRLLGSVCSAVSNESAPTPPRKRTEVCTTVEPAAMERMVTDPSSTCVCAFRRVRERWRWGHSERGERRERAGVLSGEQRVKRGVPTTKQAGAGWWVIRKAVERRGCGATRPRQESRNAEFRGEKVWPFRPFSLSFSTSGAGFSPFWMGASV
jgi:hypothetical protein